MRNLRAARRYTVAFMTEAEERNAIDAIAADLEAIAAVLRESRGLRLLVANPIVSVEKKTKVFDELFGPRIRKETLGFVHLLISKHRGPLLVDIAEQFAALRNEKLGIVTVDVKSAVRLSPQQESALSKRLESYTQKKVQVRHAVDRAITGGMVVRIGDTVLDASIKRQLELLREHLVGGGAIAASGGQPKN